MSSAREAGRPLCPTYMGLPLLVVRPARAPRIAASAQEGQNAAEGLSTGPGKYLNFPLLLGLTGLMPPPIHRAHAARGQGLAGGVLSLARLSFVPGTGAL